MATTLLLDQAAWDLTVDLFGNIAMASEPYSTAQDVASACRLFLGELWYDTAQGLPYFQRILGKMPPSQFLKARIVSAALSVPNVATAVVFFTNFKHRTLSGQIHLTTTTGAALVVGFGGFQSGLPWWTTAVSPEAAAAAAPSFTLDRSILGGGDVLA